jgi:hypothetical protein
MVNKITEMLHEARLETTMLYLTKSLLELDNVAEKKNRLYYQKYWMKRGRSSPPMPCSASRCCSTFCKKAFTFDIIIYTFLRCLNTYNILAQKYAQY